MPRPTFGLPHARALRERRLLRFSGPDTPGETVLPGPEESPEQLSAQELADITRALTQLNDGAASPYQSYLSSGKTPATANAFRASVENIVRATPDRSPILQSTLILQSYLNASTVPGARMSTPEDLMAQLQGYAARLRMQQATTRALRPGELQLPDGRIVRRVGRPTQPTRRARVSYPPVTPQRPAVTPPEHSADTPPERELGPDGARVEPYRPEDATRELADLSPQERRERIVNAKFESLWAAKAQIEAAYENLLIDLQMRIPQRTALQRYALTLHQQLRAAGIVAFFNSFVHPDIQRVFAYRLVNAQLNWLLGQVPTTRINSINNGGGIEKIYGTPDVGTSGPTTIAGWLRDNPGAGVRGQRWRPDAPQGAQVEVVRPGAESDSLYLACRDAQDWLRIKHPRQVVGDPRYAQLAHYIDRMNLIAASGATRDPINTRMDISHIRRLLHTLQAKYGPGNRRGP